MCGIAGILELGKDTKASPDNLRRMCDIMSHRGPDDEGSYFEEQVGIGMRRLSIVDLATGHQPLSNEDGSVWIVFNGEIYNHLELREQLISKGHRYRTLSDTETVVHLYEEYGKDCVQHLQGMFAFAIWDSRRKRLFISRDRLGIKPLYYQLTTKRFLFGSEIKVLLACPGAPPEFNREALPEYLHLFSETPERPAPRAEVEVHPTRTACRASSTRSAPSTDAATESRLRARRRRCRRRPGSSHPKLSSPRCHASTGET